ncbi:2-oxo acid dehydrogenase subunit E2, partial [Acidobacteria bacterium AH-259-L09]|nr:2-oxo acid dehydrogenase subunit E2 [Acidobacteria bacterium AH-259-L09]
MPFEFKLPDIGEGIVEGEIIRWLVKEGEHVEEDQPIVEVMTDKATVEIPSPLKGKIAKRIGDEGEVIKVGATMVVIKEEEEEEEGQSGVKLEPAKPRVDKPKTK